jgi:hypothetical protein
MILVMTKHNQDGAVSLAAISLIVSLLLLVVSLSFGAWAFSSRSTYKDHADELIAAAVATAKQQEGSLKDKQYAEAAKLPLASYAGPEQHGSLIVKYPKTWSVYDNSGGSTPLAWYFDPAVVPSITSETSIYALQVQVLDQAYSEVLNSLNNLAEGTTPTTIEAYSLPQLPKVVGVKLSGPLPNNQTGTMIVLPLRGETLEIWTEGDQYLSDFNNNVLPNVTFSP